jgi:hypothetical protein
MILVPFYKTTDVLPLEFAFREGPACTQIGAYRRAIAEPRPSRTRVSSPTPG